MKKAKNPMLSNKVLSIIIPMYNSQDYISRCLESVMAINIPKEIIVVDDGSTDSSYSILKRYAEGGLIRLFRQDNKGVSEARNLGILKSKGEFIAFIDSDDYIIAESFERLYHAIERSSADIAMGGTILKFKNRENEYRIADVSMQNKIYNGEDCYIALMSNDTFIPLAVNYFYRKDFIEKYKLKFLHRMSEDDLWTTTSMCLPCKIYVSGEFHYIYQIRAHSITTSNKETNFKADNLMAVGLDMYKFACNHNMNEEAKNWLYCKILYVLSVAIKIYHKNRNFQYELPKTILEILTRQILTSSNIRLKRIGVTYYIRIIYYIQQK